MSAREVMTDAAAACQSVVIHGDVYELTDYVIAALRAAGYALVPVEPTEAMVQAAADNSKRTDAYEAYSVWQSMISASKEQP